MYKSELFNKPAVLALTKMDSKGSDKLLDNFYEEFERIQSDENITLCNFDEIIPISAKFSPKTVDILKHRLRHWLDEHHTMNTEFNIENLENSLQISHVQNNII